MGNVAIDNLPGVNPTRTIEITENGDYNVSIYASANVAVPGMQLVDVNSEKTSSIYVGVSGTSYASLPVQYFKKCALCGESYSGNAYFELKDGTTTSSFGFSTGSWTALTDIPDDAVMLKMRLSTGTVARFPVYYSLLA